jgi:hypothetical protein
MFAKQNKLNDLYLLTIDQQDSVICFDRCLCWIQPNVLPLDRLLAPVSFTEPHRMLLYKIDLGIVLLVATVKCVKSIVTSIPHQ